MKPFDKRCPDCGALIRLGFLFRVRQRTFDCPACGSSLWTVHLRRQIAGLALGSLGISVPMSLGIHDHRWWWGILPGLALYTMVVLLFMRPESRRPRAASGH